MAGFINRGVLARVAAAAREAVVSRQAARPFSVIPSIGDPARSLPPGKQWVSHVGKRQIARAKRQQAALAAKKLKQLATKEE